jgi:[ribosomal protein S5]-alanine N-acetyltransferase
MDDILTQRLSLKLMSPEFLEACVNDEYVLAESILGATIPATWYAAKGFMSLRRNDYRENPDYLLWGPRAIILEGSKIMIGHSGFHTTPDPDYLKKFVWSGIEIGYTVFTEYRQQGYASEVLQGLMNWAVKEHKIANFVLSISPDNQASLAIAKKFGFVKVGEHIDEEDGLEWVFALPLKPDLSSQGT